MPNDTPRTVRRRRQKVIATGAILVVCALFVACWSLPSLLRESETVRDLQVQLGSENARVLVVWSWTRDLIDTPNGPLIGGGNWRYDTTIDYASGQRLQFTTDLQPRTIWRSSGRLFVACNDGGKWLIAEIVEGQLRPMPRAALPEPPPVWNLQPPEQQAKWDEDFKMLAR